LEADMSAKPPKKWELAVAALLTEKTVEAAAAKLGVGVSTLKAWMATPLFKEKFRQARARILEGTVNRLLALNGAALDGLEGNLTCGNPAAVNRAAELILAHSKSGLETLDLAAQLAEIKGQLAKQKEQP
jgi:hypothetical protein